MPHHVGGVAARRHEVDQRDGAVRRLERAFPGSGCCPDSAREMPVISLAGRDQPAAVSCGAEERGKAGIGIEGRPAQPVDRAVAADQRGGLAIADQPHSLRSCRTMLSPPCPRRNSRRCDSLPVAACRVSRFTIDRPRPSGRSRTGSRRRQFGCSSMVPGILGWSTTPSRSSSDDRQQTRRRSRQEVERPNRDRCGRCRAARSTSSEHLPAHASAHRRSRRDRCPSERFSLQIAEGAPAGIGRQIMGVEGDERIGPVMVDIAERPGVVALEHHHEVRPDAPIASMARGNLPARCRGPHRSPRSDWRRSPARSPPAAPRTASAHRRRRRR